MASTIRIKRSGVTGSPSSLAQSELAYSYLTGTQNNGGDRLYIGTGTETNGEAANIEVIGGKYFTDMLDHVKGTVTADAALIVDSNKKLNELLVDDISIDGSTISTTATDADLTLAPNGTGVVVASTGLEISDLTDGQVTFAGANGRLVDSANLTFDGTTLSVTAAAIDNVTIDGNTISTTDTDGNLVLDPNGTGKVDVSTANIINLADPANDQDAATKAYVDSQVSASDLSLNADTGTEQDVSLDTGNVNFIGGEGVDTTVSKSGDTVSVEFDIGQPVGTTDSVTFNNGTFTGDVAVNGGDLTTSASTFNLVNTNAATVNFAGDASAVNIGSGVSTVAVTDALTVGGTATISGDLIVNGTMTTVNTENLQVTDSLIKLADGNQANSLSIGFYGSYSTDGGATESKTGLFRNHVDGEFYLFENLTGDIQDNTIETSGIDLANMNADTVTANEFVGLIDGGTY